MKKVITLLTIVFVAALMVFTGCKKPTGTFNWENSVEYSMSASWGSYNLSVPAYGFSSYTVESGGATVSVNANGYGYWGSMYFEVPEDGSNTLYTYWDKKKDSKPIPSLRIK